MKKMKRTVRLLIMVAIVLIIAGVTVWAATLGKANSSYVRIREKATTESNVLDVLMEGDQVEILGEEGDWYKVSAKGHTGYVSKAFITKNEGTQDNTNVNTNTNTENNTSGSENNTTPATTTRTATITTRVYKVAENTQVYILPILSSESMGTVNAGEDLDLVSSAGLWGYIKTSKIKGWVRIDKLSSEEVTTTVTEEVPAEVSEEQNNEKNNSETENQENNNENNIENTNTEANNEQNNNSEPEKVEENTTENPVTENNTQEQQAQEATYTEKTMYVSATAINVRKEANTTSEVISGAALNATFTVVGEENGWYKVKVNGDYGYIRKDLLSDSKTEETSRSGLTDRSEAVKQNNADTQNKDNSTSATVATSTPAETAQTAVTTTAITTTTTAETTAQTSQQTTTQPVVQAESQTTQASTQTTQASAPAQTTAKSSSGVTGADVVAYAQQFVGCRYVYGAAGPSSFDCSGLTMYVYKHFGYNLSHSSKVQATQGVKVTGELKPGDILVFSNDGKQVGHVGLYLGNDKFIHASDYSTGVIISNLHDSWNIKKYWGARRIIQ